MPQELYALSLKQPWAALLASGRKTIEVRSWPTARRGQVLIHAARVPDGRPEAWADVPADLLPAARLVGGIVGVAELTGCRAYRDAAAFAADRPLHWNAPEWFEPVRYGLVFAGAKPLPF